MKIVVILIISLILMGCNALQGMDPQKAQELQNNVTKAAQTAAQMAISLLPVPSPVKEPLTSTSDEIIKYLVGAAAAMLGIGQVTKAARSVRNSPPGQFTS